MDPAKQNRDVTAALYRVLEALCEGCWSAVRIACVPNGLEYRFLVRIEAAWRPQVYAYLAQHADIYVPADGGSLNLSAKEAKRVGQLVIRHVQALHDEDDLAVPHIGVREPRRIPLDIPASALSDTFQS